MTASEREELYRGIRDFREKEVTIGLTEEEVTELFQLLKQAEAHIEKSANVQVDYNEKQLQVPIKVEAIRNATFTESPVKQNILERLMKKEKLVYYELHVSEWIDLQTYEWTYQFALEVKEFMRGARIG